MDVTDRLLDNLDRWRYLPSYQLERRADAFFSVYLPGALRALKKLDVQEQLIPEFPMHKGLLLADSDDENLSNRSIKIDYLAVARDVSSVVFVELKTDMGSRSTRQDSDLTAAQTAGMWKLSQGLLQICASTKEGRKYGYLLKLMAQVGLVVLPEDFEAKFSSHRKQERKLVLEQIAVRETVRDCHIIYVQPTGQGDEVINFAEYAEFVAQHGDPVSLRFARSLREWHDFPAGQLARRQ